MLRCRYIPGDPDNSGVRACLLNANCPPEQLRCIWRVLAALLKLGNVQFKDDVGVAGSGTGSAPASPAALQELSEVAGLLDLKGGESQGQHLADMLCINRRVRELKLSLLQGKYVRAVMGICTSPARNLCVHLTVF